MQNEKLHRQYAGAMSETRCMKRAVASPLRKIDDAACLAYTMAFRLRRLLRRLCGANE